MGRSLWLFALMLSIVSTSLIAENPPDKTSPANTGTAVSCKLPQAKVDRGQEVSISCTNLSTSAKVEVALKSIEDQSTITMPTTQQDGTVKFSAPNAGKYSVSLKVNSKTTEVPDQLEVATSISCVALHNVAPGQEVKLKCSGLAPETHAGEPQVSLKSAEGQEKSVPAAAEPEILTFSIPNDTKPGQYSLAADSKPIERQLNVMESVEVTGIYPGTTYEAQKGFDFKISGKNFSDAPTGGPGEPPTGNLIEIVGGGKLRTCNSQSPAVNQFPCATEINSHTNEIEVKGFSPKHYYGPVNVIVHVGKYASQQVSVTFAQVSQPGVVLAAAFVFFVVAYLLYRLVTKGLKADIVNGVTLTPWTSLFLDRETNSYSLSKFQVIAWTAVTVYSYVYLFLCRTLIQGDFRFPDVSQNLPQLFFVSAGTTVAAAAITAALGSKGAGPIQPSAADFISTGGLVAGDRFQFFTWTIVGCIGYVYLVIRMNPETPNISLPEIPQNFLYLMGVSAAGYLGGKLVRKPGPVIKLLSVAKMTPPPGTPAPDPKDTTKVAEALAKDFVPNDLPTTQLTFPVLTLNVKGENLDPTGKIKVDDNPLRGDMFWINGQPDPQSAFCSDMSISLNDAAQYIEGTKTHTLMLVNTDGQSATTTFPIEPMSIDPISVTAGTAAVDVPITGKNFVDGMKFEWKNPADTKAEAKTPTASGPATFKSGTLLVVNLVPRPIAGTGKLTLIRPIGLRGSASVTVK